MRIVIVGAGGLATTTARLLIEGGWEVILVEKDADRVATLRGALDCGLIHGDGTKPAILREAEPERCDLLLCLSGSDHDNLLSALVGRHLGFPRVVTKIEDPEFEPIGLELGLGDTIVPDRTIARALFDVVHGRSVPELVAALGPEVSLFSFILREPTKIPELDLPARTRVIGATRSGSFVFPDDAAGGALDAGDEVLLLTHLDNLEDLRQRFGPGAA